MTHFMSARVGNISRIAVRAGVICLLAGAALVCLDCSRPKRETLVRFVDRLEASNVDQSPLTQAASDAEGFKKAFPRVASFSDKFPLQDAGTGPNPYLIKKKIKAGPIEVNALFAPPKSRYAFEVRVPAGAVLEFNYGIRRDDTAVPSKAGERQTVRFTVLLSGEGKTDRLFEKTATLEPGQDLVFLARRIDLSRRIGQKVRVYFQTEGNSDALACWFNPRLTTPRPDSRPVILISLDTLRADHLGAYGYPRRTSPNLDALAADSAVFLNTFAPSPWTLPSHISLMTGLNCINHQVVQNDRRLDPSIPTLAESLHARGFFAGAFTGGGYVDGLYGFSRGFDSYSVQGTVLDKRSAEEIGREGTDWIKANRDKDFFLFLHTYQIHNPYFTPEPYNTAFLEPGDTITDINMGHYNHEWRYKPEPEAWRRNIIALYDAEVLYTDAALIRPVVETLKQLGLYDRALIIVTADHGEEFYEHKAWLHTASVYDESLKVPLIIKFPGREHRGLRVERWARLIDVMPTLQEALGITPDDRALDGRSLMGFLSPSGSRTAAGRERPFLSELEADASDNGLPRKVALSSGRTKIIWNSDLTAAQRAALLYPPPPVERYEVYDLEKDPGETRDLSRSRPELTRKLAALFEKTYKQRTKTSGSRARMSEEAKEQLKALGYIR
jgi:arylsulfatase A-like enzyme